IRINGVRVLEGKLKAGDELTIGGCRYQGSWGSMARLSRRSVPSVKEKPRPEHPVPPGRGDDDAPLEAGDGTGPLIHPAPSLPSHRPPPRGAPAKPDMTARPPPGEPSSAPILPEHLELASSSDIQLPPPRPAS